MGFDRNGLSKPASKNSSNKRQFIQTTCLRLRVTPSSGLILDKPGRCHIIEMSSFFASKILGN